MDPMVSIIVPVFNAEHYLKRCIDSILNQEFTDFELLLVDDGSSDSSCAICASCAEKDARIRLIHKENTGVSDTRNVALDAARGTYLQFIDSDDWIPPDSTRLLVRAASETGCDLVIADFYRVSKERVSLKGDIEENNVMDRETFASCMMENPADFYYGVLWNKLYRRELVEQHRLRMDTQISWCEDFLFNLDYIRHARTFYALHSPVYYYVKRKGSLVSQGASIPKTIRMKQVVFEYYNQFYRSVFDEEAYEKNRLQVYRFFVEAARDGVVPPAILPGTLRLGEERSAISHHALVSEGAVMDIYRQYKLLEYYLETAAIRHGLPLTCIWLMLYLSRTDHAYTRRELSEFIRVSRRQLSGVLQKLTSRGMIRVEEIRGKKTASEKTEDDAASSVRKLRITVLPAARELMRDIGTAQNDYEQAIFEGFDEADLIQYARFSEKVKQNSKRILQSRQDEHGGS